AIMWKGSQHRTGLLMAEHVNFFSRLLLAGCVISVSTLGGCSIVPDVEADSPPRFVQEISPVFYQPPGIDPLKVRPLPVQPVPQVRDPYQTQFNQTYGLPVSSPVHLAMYGQLPDDGFVLPAIPYDRIDQRLLRQEVDYSTTEHPGTVVVDTKARY